MQFRSRLRRGISLEVIFEEEHMRPSGEQHGSTEVNTARSRSPEWRPRRAPSLSTLNEEEYLADNGEGYPSCWDDDDFGVSTTISRRQILGLSHLYAPPDVSSDKDGDEATRRWVDAHSPRRRPLTVGELRDRHRHPPPLPHHQSPAKLPHSKKKSRGIDFLGGYRAEDLLVNDNIVIVDTTPPSTSSDTTDGDRESPLEDDFVDREIQTDGDLPAPQTVRKVADRFEKLAKAEPDSYLIWRDTSRLSGIRANPSSKILRWDPVRDTVGDQGHRLFQQELHELFRARRAAAAAGPTSENLTSGAGETDALLPPETETHSREKAETVLKSDDKDDDVDSMFSSDEGDQSCSSGGGGASGVRSVSSEALDRIRRQGLSITYHGPRGGQSGRPSLGQLVAAARRRPAYVAVATAAPRVIDYLPKPSPGRQFNTLPAQRNGPQTGMGEGRINNEALLQEMKAATLKPRDSPKTGDGGWRQTGRCYVYDFSNSSRRQPPPVGKKPSQAT